MPLILISGYPSAGKTHRSEQLKHYFATKISEASDPSHSRLRVVHVNDQTLGLSRDVYATAKEEKDARATLSSAIKRELHKETIVIADAMNYIKGFRYQLYCEAKAVQTTSCVVHIGTPVSKCRELNAQLLASSAGGYEDSLFDNLIFRYEEPNGMTRWDSPLFTVPYDDDSPPCDAIWEALVGSDGKAKVVRPNAATAELPASDPSALYALERSTQDAISRISTYLADHAGEGGGEVRIEGAEMAVQLPTEPVSLPRLQRLRRQYVALYRKQVGKLEAERMAEGFVTFLNDQWSQER